MSLRAVPMLTIVCDALLILGAFVTGVYIDPHHP